MKTCIGAYGKWMTVMSSSYTTPYSMGLSFNFTQGVGGGGGRGWGCRPQCVPAPPPSQVGVLLGECKLEPCACHLCPAGGWGLKGGGGGGCLPQADPAVWYHSSVWGDGIGRPSEQTAEPISEFVHGILTSALSAGAIQCGALCLQDCGHHLLASPSHLHCHVHRQRYSQLAMPWSCLQHLHDCLLASQNSHLTSGSGLCLHLLKPITLRLHKCAAEQFASTHLQTYHHG